jgi:hypothetical protein
MKSLIDAHLLKEIARERDHDAYTRMQHGTTDAVVIRSAAANDRGSLRRLALLDSARVPDGPMLVAEQEGMLVAAVPLGGGRAIADPFVRSAEIVGLLELRRAQLRSAA